MRRVQQAVSSTNERGTADAKKMKNRETTKQYIFYIKNHKLLKSYV
jgi:hypothetical protein